MMEYNIALKRNDANRLHHEWSPESTLLGGRSHTRQENAAEAQGPLGASEHGSHSVEDPMKTPLETAALDRLNGCHDTRLKYLGVLVCCVLLWPNRYNADNLRENKLQRFLFVLGGLGGVSHTRNVCTPLIVNSVLGILAAKVTKEINPGFS